LDHPNVIELIDVILIAGRFNNRANAKKSHHAVLGDDHLESKRRKTPAAVYLVFPFMDHDLMGIIDSPHIVRLKMPQIKCYAMQLLKGLAYIHMV
jgi:serine/threonine protein kinase